MNVFLSSYTYIYDNIRTNNSGPVLPLLNFFKSRSNNLYLLEQPLPGSDFLETSLIKLSKGKQIKKITKNLSFYKNKKRLDETKIFFGLKIRDFLSNFYFILKERRCLKKEKINLFIGVECINAICGIIFRKLGFIDKVVYYIFDWAPDRYKNPLMNWVYITLDKFATYHSDYTWNITYAIADARRNILNYTKGRMSPQLYVPYSVEFKKDYVLPDSMIDNKLIIYSGGLIRENGPDLLLKAYRIVMKTHPESRLLIIGGGNIEQEMGDYIKKNNMGDNVEITGYIPNEEDIIKLQCKGAIGVAPYPMIKGSRKPFGDVIKIRMYFACGLVTVSTPIPPVSKEIKNEGLGITTKNDSPEEISEALCFLLENKKNLFEYRKNVIKKAKSSSWNNTYSSALKQMGIEAGGAV
jgi:glycosyltransferase involved in cell wall biosynthesis